MMTVSRETQERLEAYVALLEKWTPKVNLVARSTLGDIWTRHIRDSQQVFEAAPAAAKWADLGTGAGLPGLVVAILAAESAPQIQVTLVESDRRKAEFCRTVIREIGLAATVICERIESTQPLNADIVCARALAPLDVLLEYATRHMTPNGLALFPKGAGHQAEVEDARKRWGFRLETVKSSTRSGAVLLKIGEIKRV